MKDSISQTSILIVDDEAQILKILAKILSGEGYKTFTALSGAQALEHIKSNHIDLMVVDLKMPNMDGLETLKKAKEIQCDIRAILLTGYGTATSAREAMLLGVSDFIAKPFDNKVLKKLVREVLK